MSFSGTTNPAALNAHLDWQTTRRRLSGMSGMRGVTLLVLSCLPLMLTACGAPDEAALFQRDWQAVLDKHENRQPALPDQMAPSVLNPDGVVRGTDPAHAGDSRYVDDLLQPGEDGVISLSLEAATVMGLRYNRDLAVQQLSPVIAGTFEQVERGVFNPQVFAGLEFNQEVASETDRATGQQFAADSRTASGEVGLRQQLPSGTDIEVSVTQSRDTSNRSPEQQQARVGLTVTQSLLRGFGPSVNLVQIEQAKLGTLASKYELRAFSEALLAEIEIAYWQYVLAGEEIAIFQRSLEVAEQQRGDIEDRIDVGVLPATEAAAARAEVSRRRVALIDARSALEARRLRLLRLINAGDTTMTHAVKATTRPQLEVAPIENLVDRIALARMQRPEVNEARLRLEQDRLETVATRNGLLPRLDAFVTLGKSGFADTFAESFTNIDDSSYDFTAGVSFSQFLGNRAAKGRDQAALVSRQQSAAAVANLTQLVELDVRLAANELSRSSQQVDATAETRELEQQTVDAERERFDAGASTALLVAQAQRDLLASEIAEVGARVNYRIALVGMYLAEGSLLERRGVSVSSPKPASPW